VCISGQTDRQHAIDVSAPPRPAPGPAPGRAPPLSTVGRVDKVPVRLEPESLRQARPGTVAGMMSATRTFQQRPPSTQGTGTSGDGMDQPLRISG
jgi:hypothetical protein